MYLVIEIQKFSDTQVSVVTPVITRENELEAESEYHRLLSIAAVSSVPQHTIIFSRDGGYLYEYKCYIHSQQEEELNLEK